MRGADILNIINSLRQFVSVESLTSSLAGAFFGSWSAYWLSSRSQDKKTREEQLSFLTYAVSALAHIVSQLYVLKQQIVLPRVQEAEQIEKDIFQSRGVSNVTVKLREQTKFMQAEGMISPIKVEQASFLALEDPHVIYLINSFNAGVLRLNQIIHDCNQYLSQVMQSQNNPDLNLLADHSRNFEGQTNENIYLAEKTQEVLILFGKIKFKKSFKIKSINVAKEWEYLRPPKMESWEKIKWFPKKRK